MTGQERASGAGETESQARRLFREATCREVR